MHILWYFIDRKNAHYNGYIVVPNNNSLGEKKKTPLKTLNFCTQNL